MAPLPPTEAEVDRIVGAEKRISADIEWVYSRNRGWIEFRAGVENDEGWSLTLVGKARLGPPYKRSFSLILHRGLSGFRIFSLDVNGSHRNFGINENFWNYQTHKQRWVDGYGDAFAFTPVETIPEEPNAAFLEFCQECRIAFVGRIEDISSGGQ